jgi:hypothetical protein
LAAVLPGEGSRNAEEREDEPVTCDHLMLLHSIALSYDYILEGPLDICHVSAHSIRA